MRNVKEKMEFGEEDIKVIGKRISVLAEKAIKRELGI
jgi:NACalpha-BTF3-like transcription factor